MNMTREKKLYAIARELIHYWPKASYTCRDFGLKKAEEILETGRIELSHKPTCEKIKYILSK